MYEYRAPLIGLVLAGGESSRMGNNKADLIYHDRPQGRYVFDLLSCFCTKSFFSVKTRGQSLQTPIFTDQYDIGGPLNGILSAMSAFPGHAILSIPCDMPTINKDLLMDLLEARNPLDLAVCYKNDGQIEPLFALWEPLSFDILLNNHKNLNYSAKHFFQDNPVKFLKSYNRLANINTKGDKELYLRGGFNL